MILVLVHSGCHVCVQPARKLTCCSVNSEFSTMWSELMHLLRHLPLYPGKGMRMRASL